MAQRLSLQILLYTALFYSVSCAEKVLRMDGTSVSLASGFDVKPSPVVSSELDTETLSLAEIQHASAGVESEQPYTIIPVTLTIKPTPLLTPTLIIEPTEVAEGMVDDIAATSVVKISTAGSLDVPAVDVLPPKKP